MITVLGRAAAAVNEAASKALFTAAVESLPQELLALRGWIINSKDYPILDVSFVKEAHKGRVRMRCDDWDELPPSIVFLDPETGAELLAVAPDPAGIINNSPHPITLRPFICSAGCSREYHTHSSHTGDVWDNYKNKAGFDLAGILTKVWRAWRKSL
ncbi:MAG TPA: putative metal-binding protein [Pyrinomonadaceae bacterium]|nr:putative metal-binding protein [Pyrinomonadaceae bacterium]